MIACLVRVLVGLAGVYWPGDGYTPHRTRADGRRYDAAAMTVAMRHVPLGTRIRVCHERVGRCAYAVVADRGPYWRCCARHGCSAGQTCPLGVYRSIVDLTPAVAHAIGLRGLGPVRVEIVGRATASRPRGHRSRAAPARR